MRDILLVAAILVGLGLTFVYPFAGVLLWTWFSVQNPHEQAYGFSRAMPLNFVIAAVTVVSWMLSPERKLPPNQALIWLILLFLLWTTLNSFFAVDPAWSWPFWDRTWKTFALGLVIAILATNRTRIDAIIWVTVFSLFYFGVKGGIFTILAGGSYRVLGPENTMIADNNQLALALLMGLPLANYLRRQSSYWWLRISLLGGMALTLLSVIGSYSRGAFLGLGVLAVAGLFRTRRRILYLIGAAALSCAIAYFMPQEFWDRMATIQSAQEDPSFQGRQTAWQVAYLYARDHFPLGAGFYGPQLHSVYHTYFPKEVAHAAHSIFFQVLGEHGFIGLGLYLALLGAALFSSFRILSACRGRAEMQWAHDLAAMLQMSLLAFCVAGTALSMAYYDGFVVCVSLLVPLKIIATREVTPAYRGILVDDAVHALSPVIEGDVQS